MEFVGTSTVIALYYLQESLLILYGGVYFKNKFNKTRTNKIKYSTKIDY